MRFHRWRQQRGAVVALVELAILNCAVKVAEGRPYEGPRILERWQVVNSSSTSTTREATEITTVTPSTPSSSSISSSHLTTSALFSSVSTSLPPYLPFGLAPSSSALTTSSSSYLISPTTASTPTLTSTPIRLTSTPTTSASTSTQPLNSFTSTPSSPTLTSTLSSTSRASNSFLFSSCSGSYVVDERHTITTQTDYGLTITINGTSTLFPSIPDTYLPPCKTDHAVGMDMGGYRGNKKPLPKVARTVKVPGVTVIVDPPSFLQETATVDAQPSLSYSGSPPKTTQPAGPQTGDQPTGLPTPKFTGGSSDSPNQQSELTGSSADSPGVHVAVAPTLSQLTGDNALPTAVTPSGIVLSVGSSIAVIGGTTFEIGPGATPTVQVVDGQTVSIGPEGVKLAGTAVVPQPSQGLSVAVIDGTTFTAGPEITPTVKVIDGQTISIGPAGISLVSAALSPVTRMGPAAPLAVVTAGGITFSGFSSIAIIDGTTFTTGPGATPTTKVISSQTISIGPGGIGFSTITIPPIGGPFSTITAGELTFLEGPSIAIIDGTAFAIGPGAKTTSKVIDGQTLSIGPDGIGLVTIMVRPLGSSTTSATSSRKPSILRAPSQTAKSTKKSLAVFDRGNGRGVVGVLVAIGVVAVLTWA